MFHTDFVNPRFGSVWRGQMRIMTCRIGCISPRRQARGRRSLQTPQWSAYIFTNGTPPTTWPFSATTDWEKRDLTLWRFEVREKGARPCTAWGKAIFHNVFPKCFSHCSVGADPPLRPLSSRSLKRTVHVFSSVVTDLPRGVGDFATRLISYVTFPTKAPISPFST